MPLKVIVVGAGIAGLTVATALRQAGHDVEIFEKSAFTGEVGAALTLTPNGSRVLTSLGFSLERARACKALSWDTHLGESFERVNSVDFRTAETKWGAACFSVHRVDLHNELLRLATSEDAAGSKPVTLRLGQQVVGGSPDGSIMLKDGSSHTADLIVAADGLHSALRDVVLKDNTKAPSPSGLSAFRFMIDTKVLEDDPNLAKLLEIKGPGFTLVIDEKDKVNERHMVWYACRGGEVQNFAGIHPTRPVDSEDAETDAMKESMLKEFGHFNPKFIQIISQSSHVKSWPLYLNKPLPNWSNGRILLIGDAAHAMLPFSGQGANSAMEDGGALGYLFRDIHDPAEVEKRLKLFELVRKDRVSRVQILSTVRAGQEKVVEQELKKYADPPGSAVPTSHQERTNHDYGHDVFAKCGEVLRQSQAGEIAVN